MKLPLEHREYQACCKRMSLLPMFIELLVKHIMQYQFLTMHPLTFSFGLVIMCKH